MVGIFTVLLALYRNKYYHDQITWQYIQLIFVYVDKLDVCQGMGFLWVD